MDAAEYDSLYAPQVHGWIKNENWIKVIELHKNLCLTGNPDQPLRIELLAGIAMAQVGMAETFTRHLTEVGLELRAELGVTAEEAKEIASIIGTSLGLQADGMSQVTFPPKEASDAQPE